MKKTFPGKRFTNMTTWELRYSTDRLALSDRAPLDVVSVSGIGPAGVRLLEERTAQQHGATISGGRLEPRTINMALVITTDTAAEADTARQALQAWLTLLPGALTLVCTRDDGAERLIDVWVAGMVDTPIDMDQRAIGFQKLAVQFRAADPTWYDAMVEYWSILGGAASGQRGFAIPMTVAWVQATQTFIDARASLAYEGTWYEYPIVTMYGPGTGWTLTNETTGDVLDFPTLTLTAGQYVEVDLRYGYKSITDHAGANRVGELSTDSDLATWHLAPAPAAAGGVNQIRLAVGSGAADATGVRLSYYNRYIGL